MGNRRKGLSVAQAAEITGLSESTVRRWADNGIAEREGRPLPYPGQGKLSAWRAATRRGSAGVRGTGQERRVDRAAAEAEGARRAARTERRIDPVDAERVGRENAGEPAAGEAADQAAASHGA